MDRIDKQILKALVYIRDNPDCSVDDSDNINDKLIHYLYQNNLVEATDSKTIHMQEDEYGYCYINITLPGESRLVDIQSRSSLLGIFKNKSVRFVIASIFLMSLTILSGIIIFDYQQSRGKPTQESNK